MTAIDGRQAGQAAPIFFDPVRSGCNVTVLGGGDVDEALVFVNPIHFAHFPSSIGDLANQFSIGPVVIKMAPAVALAFPEKRTVF